MKIAKSRGQLKERVINDEIRPSVRGYNPDTVIWQLINKERSFNVNVDFKGWVRRIDTDSPKLLNELRLYHHVERYWFVRDYLKSLGKNNLNVFDIGIGEGHGIREMKKNVENIMFKKISGIEIDRQIASELKTKMPDVDIHTDNIEKFESAEKYDAVLCFELIGNESLSSDEILIQKLDKLCIPGGHIFLSIAAFGDSAISVKRAKKYSPRIYNRDSFKEIIERCLCNYRISYYGQIYPIKRMFSEQVGVWENPLLKRETDFLICVAEKMETINE